MRFTDSREKSFVYSVTSAGVMHSITSACKRGEIGNCGCDTSVYELKTKEQFEWGGCSHNPEFGAKFAQEFVDTNEHKDTADGKMNLWNNKAGRTVSNIHYIVIHACYSMCVYLYLKE